MRYIVLGLSLVFVTAASAFDMTGSNVSKALDAACHCVAGVSIGVVSDKSTWRIDYVDGVTAQQVAAAQAALQAFDPLAPSVPVQVTSAQAKIALYRAGLLDQVKTAVAASPEMQLWYDNAVSWERANSFINQLGTQLGLTSAQIDNLFVQAAQIK